MVINPRPDLRIETVLHSSIPSFQGDSVVMMPPSAFVSSCSTTSQVSTSQTKRTISSTCNNAARLSTVRTSPIRVSAFTGRRVYAGHVKKIDSQRDGNNRTWTTMIVDPWSVSPEAIDQLAVQFFGGSLFPYLAFLYFLSRKEVDCPPLANFGFRFLLVFVFATIPAGIYAKQAYGTILANVDWLHGTAESFLTITNLLIVIGFRQALSKFVSEAEADGTATAAVDKGSDTTTTKVENKLQSSSFATASVLVFAMVGNVLASLHAEPGNALSLPTWIVHASSLLEWLAAMGLIWEYADATGRQEWKGLVWGMLPLHTSGICACTYHLFYNAPSLNALVALQAGLTFFGNALMAVATWRITKAAAATGEGEGNEEGSEQKMAKPKVSLTSALSRQGSRLPDGIYYSRLAVGTVFLSGVVKWGSLTVDWPFNPTLSAAGALILIPTAANMAKWAVRSKTGKELLGGWL